MNGIHGHQRCLKTAPIKNVIVHIGIKPENMKNGKWIPISKGFINYLPKDREYTKLEAAYSLQVDYDCKNTVTVTGYSDLWQWSRKRVYNFLKQMNIKITYPENTTKKRNQRGFLGVHKGLHKRDIKGTYKEHIRLIENNHLEEERNIKGTKEGHKRDIKGSTTIEPKNLKPKNKDLCPHNEIIKLYHNILDELPSVREWTEPRKRKLRARWNSKIVTDDGTKINSLKYWENLFNYVKDSDFLMGRKTDFISDLEWIVTKSNFVKIREEKYNRRKE